MVGPWSCVNLSFVLAFFFSGVNEFEDEQLLEPRNRHPICFVGPFWAARLSSWFIPSGSRFHAATQDVRSCSTLPGWSLLRVWSRWIVEFGWVWEFEQSFLLLFARAQGFRSRVEFMDFVDWKLPLTCAYTIKSRIWLSHPSASSGVRGSVLSSSCTCHVWMLLWSHWIWLYEGHCKVGLSGSTVLRLWLGLRGIEGHCKTLQPVGEIASRAVDPGVAEQVGRSGD